VEIHTMMSRLLASFRVPVIGATLLLLAACSQQQAPAPAETPAAAATTVAPAKTAPAAAPTAASTAEATAPAAPNNNPVVAPQGPAPVAGTDYVEIAGGQAFQPTAGKIEVVEVFGYTCPHCAHFEPLVKAWEARQPADVQFVPLAAPFGGYWQPYAKAFYTAQSLGLLDRSHDAMFNAIHVDRSMPVQPSPTNEQIGEFYAKYGVDAKQFASTMSSFAIDAKVKHVSQFIQRCGVESTPTIVVAGKYRVIGKSFEDMLRITDHLVAQERAKADTAAGG
jgi:protein dithiol oxidoreductase (disulfide-forming)